MNRIKDKGLALAWIVFVIYGLGFTFVIEGKMNLFESFAVSSLIIAGLILVAWVAVTYDGDGEPKKKNS
jgi:hypothetical protein